MNSSTYPDGVLVDHVALRRTELTKAAEILRNRVDLSSRGMFSGGAITVNAIDGTKIDIAMLSGFAPNGEFLETDSDYYSIALQDYTLNTTNVIVAVYTENATYRQPTESSGITLPTCAEMAWRIRVYSEANFALLAATDPNLGNDAIDRCIIIGKVTANGALVNLTTSNIFSPTSYTALLYSSPMTFTTIPGVTVLAVSTDTVPGVGALEHYCLGGPVQYLRWQAPNMVAWAAPPPGAPPGFGWVEITVDGNYSLPGSTGTYITVQVILSMLPTVITTLTSAAATIYDIYYQEIPRQTSEDLLHRSLLGSGILTPNNPHALSVSDLSGSDLGLLAEHEDTQHGNGFLRISSPSCAQATISFPLTADALNLVPMTGVDAYLCNGKRITTFAPTSFMFDAATIPTSVSGSHGYEVLLSDDGVAFVNHKCMVDESGGPRTVTGTWIVGWSENYPAGAYDLSLTVGANYALSWDSGEVVTVLSTAASQVVRLFAADSEKWVDVYVNTDTALISPDGNLPGAGVVVDSVIMYATPDLTQNLLISTLCGWWDLGAAPPRFGIGFPPYGVSREVVDTRPYGTLAAENVSDSLLEELRAPEDELHESGVLYKRNTTYYDFATYAPAGLSISIRGGGLYCRGKRIDFAGATQVLYDNKTNLLYVDAGGTLRVIDVTTTFAGSVPNAVNYVIGGTKLIPWASDVYHGDVDDPERGVALYAITTAGGAITSTVNLMYNINGPCPQWSVSSFTSAALSTFDSLYSAFLYAGLRTARDKKLVITLNGASSITATVTQPSNVEVVGGSGAIVSINVVDAAGAWRLSAGCKVSGFSILMTVDGGVGIALQTGVTVEHCYYTSSAANTDTFLYSGGSYTMVHLLNNTVLPRTSFVTATSGQNYSWWISNNTVIQAGANTVAGSLINVRGYNINVKNNKLVTNNTTALTEAIKGRMDGEWLIDGNDIELGTGADTAYHYGIYMSANNYSPRIINNTIKSYTGSVSHVDVGIYVDSGSAIIKGNTFASLGCGIMVKSNVISNLQIEGNNITGCYHYGILVAPSGAGTDFTVFDNVSIRGNTISGITKNAGGAGTFGTDAWGIFVFGSIASSVVVGNLTITDNAVSTITSALGVVHGIRGFFYYDTAAAPILAGYECISVNGNNVRDLSSSLGSVGGIYLEFIALNLGNPSILACRSISISNNNVKGVLSSSTNAYGIYCAIDLDTSHTTTGLNGLAVNGNNVSGFWGDLTDPTSTSAGIHLDGVSILDEVWAVTCNSNNVASNSLMITGAGFNDATFVYGVFNNFTNSVISSNNISFTGLATTVRGDGIRCFPKGLALPTLRSVISGNAIDVGWTGIHLKGEGGTACTFDVSGNRINTKSVGIYMDVGVSLSSISTNVIYSVPSNACSYDNCVLTGGGCIVGRTSWPVQTSISGNNVSLVGSLGTYSANIWLYTASGCSVDGNLTYQAGGAPVGTVSHIYVKDSATGIISVSGNTVDNTVRPGACGINVVQTAASDVNAVLNVLNNKVFGSNTGGAPGIYEIFAAVNGGLTNPVAYVYGNIVHCVAGPPDVYPVIGSSGIEGLTMLYDDTANTWTVCGNVRTSGAGGVTKAGW